MFRRHAKRLLDSLRSESYEPLNRIELDAANMLHNLRVIEQAHPGFVVIPVLKGNAYGHGLRQVATILRDADCDLIAVDGYFEAHRLLDIAKQNFLVMGYVLPQNVQLLDTKRCSFVVQDQAGLAAFGKLGKRVRIHLELNTGMNRLGLQPEELGPYLETLRRYPNLELEGVMTHLADADNARDDAFTDEQAQRFDAGVEQVLAAGFKPALIHIAQTAGSVKVHSRYANGIRLGIGLYGLNPLSPNDHQFSKLAGLKPVLELKSTIIKVLELEKGETVSYSRTYTATKPSRIAVLPLGYYEGVPRELSNKGVVTAGKHVLPIRGRVCMDHIMIDITDTDLAVQDEVTVFSKDPDQPNAILQLQEQHGLFPYSVCTGLAESVRRTII